MVAFLQGDVGGLHSAIATVMFANTVSILDLHPESGIDLDWTSVTGIQLDSRTYSVLQSTHSEMQF